MGDPPIDVTAAFNQIIYNSSGEKLKFGDLFTQSNSYSSSSASASHQVPDPHNERVLVIFVRHFFCGNCQEYLRSLATSSLSGPRTGHDLRIAIVGCGSSSLMNSYRAMASIPDSWQLFTEPTTELHTILGMHRTLSMGGRNPRYITRSLTGNALRSIWQGVRRIPAGDVLDAGQLHTNGGEFLFELRGDTWTISWCHRMTNSRDHTEVEDLLGILDSVELPAIDVDTSMPSQENHVRAKSLPVPSKSERLSSLNVDPVKRSGSFRRSLSIRRQNRMPKGAGLGRVISLRAPRQAVAA